MDKGKYLCIPPTSVGWVGGAWDPWCAKYAIGGCQVMGILAMHSSVIWGSRAMFRPPLRLRIETMNRLAYLSLLVLTFSVAFVSSASAKGTVCEHVQEDMFSIDGMADDWQGLGATTYGGGKDAELRLRCAYDKDKLYLLLDVSDERVLRSKRANAKAEDRIAIALGAGKGKSLRIELLPGSRGVPRKLLGAGLRGLSAELEDSLQDAGFSVELSVPLRKIPGFSPTVPYLTGRVLFYDADLPSDGRAQTVIGLRGKLHFSDAAQTYKAFMRAAGLRNADVRLDELADVDPGAGAERVIIGGKVMGVLGTSFNFMNLPIAAANDLKSCRLVDFDGSGRKAVLTELRQFGNGGSRDILVVWFAQGDGRFEAALTIETRKEMGAAHLENTWELVPRGVHRAGAPKPKKNRKKPRGADILVRVGEAVGFSAQNYREAPAPDARPILTPWGEQDSAVYYFNGASAGGGEPGEYLR